MKATWRPVVGIGAMLLAFVWAVAVGQTQYQSAAFPLPAEQAAGQESSIQR